MTTNADAFERAWGSRVRGAGVEADPGIGALVAVAEGLRSFQEAVQAPDADRAWARLSEALGTEFAPVDRTVVPMRPRAPRRRLVLRLAAAAVAVFAAVATISLRATPGSFLYPLRTGLEKTALLLAPHNGALHLNVAEARLGDLVHALQDGPASAAPGLARDLVSQRSAAIHDGESVQELDTDIASEVPPALAGVDADTAAQVRAILGSLLPAAPAATGPPAPSGPPSEGSGGPGSDGSNGGSGSGEGSSGSGSGDSGSGDGGSGTGDGGSGSGSGDGGSGTGDGGSGSGDGGSGGGSGDTGSGGSGSGDGGSGTGDGGSGPGSGDTGSGGSGSGTGDGGSGSGSGSSDGGSGSDSGSGGTTGGDGGSGGTSGGGSDG